MVKREREQCCLILMDELDPFRTTKLNIMRAKELFEIVDTIDVNVKNLKNRKQFDSLFYHIGGDVHVSVTSGIYCVDIRHFWMDAKSGELKPSRKGIALKIPEWDSLKLALPLIVSALNPELSMVNRCVDQLRPHNCYECNPNSLL